MASLLLGVVGAGIGFWAGGPAGAKLGFSLGVTIGGVIFPPRGEAQSRGRLDDLRVTGSGYGSMIPKVFGKARIGGNIIWSTDLVEDKEEEDVGGKGGGTEITTYSYYGNFAVSICEGPITEVLRIWAEDLLIYDTSQPVDTDYDITIYTGTETQIADPLMESFEGVGNVPAYRGQAYVVFNQLPLRKWGNRIPALTFEVNTGSETVGSILGDLFQDVGLEPSEFDVTDANTRIVDGFVIQNRSPLRELINPLLIAFQCDLSEADGKLNAIAQGGSLELTVSEDDLGADFFGNEPSPKLQTRRVQELELPAEIEVTYFDVDKGYETGSQRAVRYTKGHLQEKVTISLPCVLTGTRARQVAETELYRRWIEREQHTLLLPPSYLRALPGTITNLPVNGDVVRCRVVQMDMPLFGPLQVSYVRDEDRILEQIIDGASLGPYDITLDLSRTKDFIPFCSNALRDEDADSVGFYMAAAGYSGWSGVSVYKSRSGNAYRGIGFITDSATYGETLSTLSDGETTGAFQPDTVTLDIRLDHGTVETTSVDEVLAGANAALVGEEVLQFTTAVSLGGSDYRLSGFLRGQRGSDYAWGSHATGERFVLLNSAVRRINVRRDLIGKTLNLKAIAEGQQLADVAATPLLITGAELVPYAPVHITGSRDGSDNLTIDWVRRSRKNGELEDGSDIELDQPYEQYEVEIWDSSYTVLKRTISGLTAPQATYSAANQTTDFGSPQSSIEVKVFQLGDFKTGTSISRVRGYPGLAEV